MYQVGKKTHNFLSREFNKKTPRLFLIKMKDRQYKLTLNEVDDCKT